MKFSRLLSVTVLFAFPYVFGTVADAQMNPKNTAFDAIDRNKEEIAKVGDSIFYFAELGMQEIETSKILVTVLRDIGYGVETGISGFPTGFMATYGSGKPVIAVHVEYDALPSGSQTPGSVERKELVAGAPGHAEGHNTNAAVMVGAAFAIKEAMDKHQIKGTIKLFGAPAEKQLVSRPFFVRDGYFDGVNVALHVHVGDELSVSYGLKSSALMSVEYEFFGKTAHASSAWTGISAVDAAKLMDIGWDVLREHLPPTQRSHSVIKDGGIQPNVVPDYAKIWFFFRETTAKGANNLYMKAKKVAEGAAMMTGATWKETVLAACWPNWDNKAVAEVVQSNIELVGMPEWSEEDQALARRVQRVAVKTKEIGLKTKVTPLTPAKQSATSNDAGDITYVVPHVRITFPANIPGAEFHNWAAAVATATPIAHKGEVVGAKVLAGSMIDFMTKPEMLVAAKQWFDKGLAEEGIVYKPLLPPETKPPLHLNVEEMGKYREQLKKFYLNVPIQFK